ncbi:MAG: hypothetical protein WD988_03260 [Candidatus Curtissbacteria bacterium]
MIKDRISDQGFLLEAVLERNRRQFSQWALNPHERRLRMPDDDLSMLIPPGLVERASDPTKVEIVRLDQWLGRMDQEFKPALHLLVVERDAEPVVPDEHWNEVLTGWSKKGVEEGKIGEGDKPLLLLVANDGLNPLGQAGVEVITFVLNSDLRGSGIGSQFYDRFEEIVRTLGYDYIFGSNNETNVGFFLKRGRYRASELKQDVDGHRFLAPKGKNPDLTTVKFLNPEFENKVVDPRFLKIPLHG